MKNIVAIHIQGNTLLDSLGRSIIVKKDAQDALFDFLMIDKPDSFIVCWNLYQLMDLIRQVIPDDKYQTLLESDKVWVNGYKIFCSQGKKLSIKHEYRTLRQGNIYDSYTLEVDIYNLQRFFPKHQPDNIKDIEAKGIELLTTLDTMGMKEPTTLASGIAVFESTIMSENFIPHLYDCPDEAIDMSEYAIELLAREWRAVYKIGCWQPGYDIDVNGCYPSIVRNFGDLSEAKIWYGKKYQACDFGLFKGYITIDADICPIVNQDKQPVKGRYLDVITTDQWAFLNKYKIGKFEPIDGWMLKYQNDYKPFYDIMTTLYAQREAGGLVSDISKSIAVGLIGQLAQFYDDKKGKHYNPIYSVMATSRASLKLGKLIYDNSIQNNLISVTVDGILVDKPIPSLDTTKELGGWRTQAVEALVLSVGHSYVGDKHPGNHTFKDMMTAIKRKPKYTAYNSVELVQDLNTTNRVFTDYPKTGNDWISKLYASKAIEVT